MSFCEFPRLADCVSSCAVKAASADGCMILQATPEGVGKSFNIFDSGSVQNARDTLKANVEKAASEARDPAERVFPIGRPGETQEVRMLVVAVDRWTLRQSTLAPPF